MDSFTAGTGPDTLVLKISEDAYQGHAQFNVKVDGVQIGNTFTATADNGRETNTVTLKGNWAAGPHTVSVEFLNDAWGGTSSTDRNLYVDSITYNGDPVDGTPATFLRAGAQTFTIQDDGGSGGGAAPSPGTGGGGSAPPPAASGDAMLGVYTGNTADSVLRFENWLGRQVDGVVSFVDQSGGWSRFVESARWFSDSEWAKIDRPVFWSVPLIVEGASLESAASGAYRDYWRKVAEHIADTPLADDGKIHVRTGWEFNASWFPWAAKSNPEAYKAAFREFVETFREVSDKFSFEWSTNIADMGMNPELAYPGDDVVDVIGVDFYWGPDLWGQPRDPNAAWDYYLNTEYGLAWHRDFAEARGKPMAYGEWSVQSGANAGPYLQKAKAWFEQNDVVYQAFWDSDAGFPGRLSDGSDSSIGSAFRDVF